MKRKILKISGITLLILLVIVFIGAIPEVKYSIRTHPQIFGAVVTNPENNDPFPEENMLSADNRFLEVFNFLSRVGNNIYIPD